MNKFFTHSQKYFTFKFSGSQLKMLPRSTKTATNDQTAKKSGPSEFSLALIRSYAAALQVVNVDDRLKFDVLSN